MMDLSDGLAADLPRLAAASRCAFTLEESALPRTAGCTVAQAVTHGEDYELLFALAPRQTTALEAAWKNASPASPSPASARSVQNLKSEI